jgi:hypothetical protein
MAVNSIDSAIAGRQPIRFFYKASSNATRVNSLWSWWGVAGIPCAGVYDTTLNGVVLSSTSAQVPGQLPFSDPVSGNSYLARFTCGHQIGNNTYSVILADRLWHNGGFSATSTSAQTMTTPTWPARDINGSTDGEGVFIGVEISATMGNASPAISISYTNSAGTSGRTGALGNTTATNMVAQNFIPFTLQAGDTGVRSVQSITLSSSWVSGTFNLVAYRPICFLEATGQTDIDLDCLTGGLPRLYDGSVPFMLSMCTNTNAIMPMYGVFQVTQG